MDTLRPDETIVFKVVPRYGKAEIKISCDVFLPAASKDPSPVLLYIHGGAFVSGNKGDIAPPLVYRFLSRNFVVVSVDYRLLPESNFYAQLQDICDSLIWIQNPTRGLQSNLREAQISHVISMEKLVVVGVSSGALLASQIV
jgi:acetyl esterase/lipase